MAARPKVESDTAQVEVVLVPMAYLVAKTGEVVQLHKGDVIAADRYKPESLGHLRSIGFIGTD